MSIETLGRKQKLVRRTWLITPPLLSKLYLPRKASREEQRKKTTQFYKENSREMRVWAIQRDCHPNWSVVNFWWHGAWGLTGSKFNCAITNWLDKNWFKYHSICQQPLTKWFGQTGSQKTRQQKPSEVVQCLWFSPQPSECLNWQRAWRLPAID